MEFLLNRYRNLSVLLVAILAQLALLAYQVKSSQDVRLIRVWAYSAVTPLARVLEAGRSGTSHFFHNYFLLLGVREERDRMKAELEQSQLDNQYLRAQLGTAENAKALSIFKPTSRSRTLAAHNIGRTTDTNSQVIMVDRGSLDGVQRGQAVETPEGIVGKVISVYPTASDVLLITDRDFAAFVVSAKHHIHGTLKGKGDSTVIVDHIENEETVEPGELFLTDGNDLIFPRGTPAGQVTLVKEGRKNKEIYLTPIGIQNGVDDVLIVIDGIHGAIPDAPPEDQQVHLLAPPEPDESSNAADVPAQSGTRMTDMDRVTQKMKAQGAEQNHVFGGNNSPAPDYNRPLTGNPAPAPAPPPRP